MFRFFYTDDQTGRRSGTTLRAWLTFGLFFGYCIAFGIREMMGFETSQGALSLLALIGGGFAMSGAMYGYKRRLERFPRRNSPPRFDEVAPDDHLPD